MYVVQGSASIAIATVAIVAVAANLGEVYINGNAQAEAYGSAALVLVSGLALLVAAVGLFRVKPWAWTLAMATQCWSLTTSLYDYLSGDASYFLMVLAVLTVLLLNQREVRLVFEPPDRRDG
jgi:membrane protein YdbS with pleckstrin-like domain